MNVADLIFVIPDDTPPIVATHPGHERLARLGAVQVHANRAATEAELAERIAAADVVINVRSYSQFSDSVLARAPRLRFITVLGTGVDNIDLTACARRGIAVANTPDVNAWVVAEHALALMLAVTRRLFFFDQSVRRGEWTRDSQHQLLGATLGVVGLGAIGRRVARLGVALGMRVVAWSWNARDIRARELGAELLGWEELFCVSDVVSLHLRLTPESTGLVGAKELKLMKPSAVLINTARGAVVDHAALVAALSQQQIAGAGLDVFPQEPLPKDDPLLSLPNVLLTPHNASHTPQVLSDMVAAAIQNVEAFVAGRPWNLVALPQV